MWILKHGGNWQSFGVVKLFVFPVDQMSGAAVFLSSMESWLNSVGDRGETFPKPGHLILKDCS